MKITMIGSYPKPEYVNIPDWFKTTTGGHYTNLVTDYLKNNDLTNLEENFNKAIEEVIKEQINLNIDIITDGEIRRENYIHAFCRSIKNIDFSILTERELRNGAYKTKCPTIVNKLGIKDKNKYFSHEWYKSNQIAKKYNATLKFTLPGPMTICETLSNIYYKNDKEICNDLVPLLRREILYLKSIGCKEIQIDEPLFARHPKKALDWGIDLLDCIIKDISNVFFTVHICCGYPNYLDQINYKKADNHSYNMLAKALDNSYINAISIEDAHCHQDLSFIKKIKKKTLVFGVIAIAKSKIESVTEITERINEALKFINKERLIIAPDCGLGFLPKSILHQKLKNMVSAVKLLE